MQIGGALEWLGSWLEQKYAENKRSQWSKDEQRLKQEIENELSKIQVSPPDALQPEWTEIKNSGSLQSFADALQGYINSPHLQSDNPNVVEQLQYVYNNATRALSVIGLPYQTQFEKNNASRLVDDIANFVAENANVTDSILTYHNDNPTFQYLRIKCERLKHIFLQRKQLKLS